ncbi:MAG TPA: class I SAM-dependent methyltransferase [Usitatibacter sp.]|nr:class I SAM-dependent methyltransferase [Usitatibacter sp.]
MSATPGELQRTFSGSIPAFYDECLGAAWFGKFAADLARRLPADPGGPVLEIACGTGLMTRHLRERLDPRRTLVATDLSEAMLDYARGKLAGLHGIEWRQADATKLPVADGEFAAVVCSFGVMYARDRPALFAEMRRVLQPGGLLVFNVWDRVENNPCIRVYAEVIESMFPGDEEVQFRLPYEMYDEHLLRQLLDGARFEPRKIEKVRIAVDGVTARDIATGQVRGSPRGLLLAQRGVDFDVAIERVVAALEDAGGKGTSFRSHCQAIAVEARAVNGA